MLEKKIDTDSSGVDSKTKDPRPSFHEFLKFVFPRKRIINYRRWLKLGYLTAGFLVFRVLVLIFLAQYNSKWLTRDMPPEIRIYYFEKFHNISSYFDVFDFICSIVCILFSMLFCNMAVASYASLF